MKATRPARPRNRRPGWRRLRRGVALAFLVGCLLGSGWLWWGARPAAPLLFVNARVLTFDAQDRIADSVLVIDGRIVAVGRAGMPIDPVRAAEARRIDLAGATLMPGFVDAHSHFPAVELARFGVDLTPPPDGGIADLTSLFERLRGASLDLPPGRWLIGFDYDESSLSEGRHPTRRELDDLSMTRPIWLRHRSGHMGVGNSAALAALGMDERSAVPHGGRARRDEEGLLNGLLQERAAPSLARLLQEVPWARRFDALPHARDAYLTAGVTTVQNGHASVAVIALLGIAQRLGVLPQHVVVWPAGDGSHRPGVGERLLGMVARWLSDERRLRVGAIKLIADGSPQGMTAWLSQPYPLSSGQAPQYRGVSTLLPGELEAQVFMYHDAGHRLAIHANGDAAIDAALDAIEVALQASPRADHRHLIVHAQTVRTDQLRRMATLGVGASFFPSHVRYWGGWHRDRSLGPARAARISPLAEADAAGVRYSLHTDSPVTPMRPFDVVSVAAERRMPSGEVLGPEQRVSRTRALRALTIDAAWQAGLEHDRGSIEPGKRADLITLVHDPREPANAAVLAVQRVWIDGREHPLR